MDANNFALPHFIPYDANTPGTANLFAAIHEEVYTSKILLTIGTTLYYTEIITDFEEKRITISS